VSGYQPQSTEAFNGIHLIYTILLIVYGLFALLVISLYSFKGNKLIELKHSLLK